MGSGILITLCEILVAIVFGLENLTFFAKSDVWIRAVESASLKVGKSLKIGKNRINSDKKSDNIGKIRIKIG